MMSGSENPMSDSLDIRDLLVAISRMPEGRRTRGEMWYESQKEHWIGWLLDYQGGGAYGRKVRGRRDAKRVYNQLQCPDMVIYLAKESGVGPGLIRKAKRAAAKGGSTTRSASKCGAIREILPWNLVLEALLKSGYLPATAVDEVARGAVPRG
jgi:hypothetical protein